MEIITHHFIDILKDKGKWWIEEYYEKLWILNNEISKDITYFDFKSIGSEILETRGKEHNIFSWMSYLLKNTVPFKVMSCNTMKKTLRNLSQKSIKLDLVWYCANLSLQLNRIRFPFLIKKAIAATLCTDTSLPQNPNPPHHVSLPTLMHFCVIKRWGWEFWVKLFVETTFINWLWRIRKTSPKYIPCTYVTQTWVTIGHFTLCLNKGKGVI